MIDRTLARLPDDDEDARYWRDNMPTYLSLMERNRYRVNSLVNIPFRPKRSQVFWRSRVDLAHLGCKVMLWLVAPPRLQAFAVGYMSTILVRDVMDVLESKLRRRSGIKPHVPFRGVTFFLSEKALLVQLLCWRPESNTPRFRFPSALLRFGFGPAFFNQRLLMFFDIFMRPTPFLTGLFLRSKMPMPMVVVMEIVSCMAIRWSAATATWWLERRVLALTGLGSAL